MHRQKHFASANAVISFKDTVRRLFVWYKPLKTLMSETLACVDWMDFHAGKTLPERFHTVILFHDLHISQICLCMHSHINKHTFRKHLIC